MLYRYARVLFAQQNTIKTAFWFSRIDFYFVTAFYSLYDICMTDMKPCFLTRRHEEHVFRQEDMCWEVTRILNIGYCETMWKALTLQPETTTCFYAYIFYTLKFNQINEKNLFPFSHCRISSDFCFVRRKRQRA